MPYPTLATGTVVERKGDDDTDRQSHLVIDHGKPEEKPEEVKPVEPVEDHPAVEEAVAADESRED